MDHPRDMIVSLWGTMLSVWMVVRLIRVGADTSIIVAALVFLSVIVLILQRCVSARPLSNRLTGEAFTLVGALISASIISYLINPGATLQETFKSADFWLLPAAVLLIMPLLELNEL